MSQPTRRRLRTRRGQRSQRRRGGAQRLSLPRCRLGTWRGGGRGRHAGLGITVGWEEVSGLEASPFSLFISKSVSRRDKRRKERRKVAYHVHTRNLYTKKSPAATNSSVAHEQKDVNEVDDRARTGCNAAVFFEFALLEWVIGDGEMVIADNGARWA